MSSLIYTDKFQWLFGPKYIFYDSCLTILLSLLIEQQNIAFYNY